MGHEILNGDCREVMKGLADCSVDSIVTDPPYELGFMGKGWDKSGIAYDVEVWREALRVLKPGGHLLAFGGSRTYHRLACAIEDAGFAIRDQIMWLYGSGFPKSLDVGKAIDAAAGAEREIVGASAASRPNAGAHTVVARGTFSGVANVTVASTDAAKQWDGWGTALKPAHEPIVLARKPLIGTVAENVLRHGTGGLNIDGCRIETGSEVDDAHRASAWSDHAASRTFHGDAYKDMRDVIVPNGRWPANVITSYPEDEYIMRVDVSADQKREVYEWLAANA